MPIDKSQFYQVFFEETAEHLEEMERLLINLNIQSPSQDDLNAIFREVHSIKGASSTFGFSDLAEVAHILESLLDKLRHGELTLASEMIDFFLQAGDVLKAQLAGHRDGADVDPAAAEQACEQLKQLAGTGRPKDDHQEEKKSDPNKGNPGYGFLENTPDPGYGFFEEVPDKERRSPNVLGRRATDQADLSEGPIKTGRRSTDRPVNALHTQGETSSIRVGIGKVDQLINQVGELVITQAMLAQTARHLDPSAYEKLQNGLEQLERNTRDLQESALSIRMVPMKSVFSRFPRLVRDLAGKLNKQVELVTMGEETELDKGLIERLVDPLTHLVRNCLDHGIEPSEQRIAAGKEPKGVITLCAFHQGGNVVIEVGDDGAGLNREKILAKALERGLPVSEAMSDQEVWQLILAPGFSTAEVVTDVSGRGVGMDVVKKNVQAMGGRLEIRSEQGRGSRFVIRLPLTLAIIEGITVRVGSEVFIVPLLSIVESIRPRSSEIKKVVGKGEVVEMRGEFVMMVRLYRLFGITPDQTDPAQAVLVIAESEGERIALLVDELLGQQQVVIKSLEQNFKKVEGIAGATILGDGQAAFILDVRGLLALTRQEGVGASVGA